MEIYFGPEKVARDADPKLAGAGIKTLAQNESGPKSGLRCTFYIKGVSALPLYSQSLRLQPVLLSPDLPLCRSVCPSLSLSLSLPLPLCFVVVTVRVSHLSTACKTQSRKKGRRQRNTNLHRRQIQVNPARLVSVLWSTHKRKLTKYILQVNPLTHLHLLP